MFDNPKKELERIQEQLLAAERRTPEDDFDDYLDDDCAAPDPDGILDDELYAVLYDDRELSRRCAAFGVNESSYTMDSDRYVPAPKKRRFGRFLLILFVAAILAAVLIARQQGWLS